jgi:uridine kinase
VPRDDVLRALADALAAEDPGHPLRVGIDGVCGAGKSTFARDLAASIEATGRPVVHVDSDGFHHVRERRYRQGRESARGYYDDAYDFDSLVSTVLQPLAVGAKYAVKVHDLPTDAVIDDETAGAPANAIVLFDATFIQRPELREFWDEVIFLDVPEAVAQERGVRRDADALGGEEKARAAYDSRYMEACRIYLREVDPRSLASIVIEHSDPRNPVIERLPSV